MVRATPSGGGGGGGGERTRQNSSRSGMEWSLRQLRKIDNSQQHFLRNYYASEDESLGEETAETVEQTAYEIFKGNQNEKKKDQKNNISGNIHNSSSLWAALNVPLRTGVVDGRKVVFELRQNVTQKPGTSRNERLKRNHIIANANRSPLETRLRLACMHLSVVQISIVYFITFIALNVFYATLFYLLDPEHSLGDSEADFADTFNFAVQTSCTIGYGVLSPHGHVANLIVVFLSFAAILVNTLFAGLLFTKFVTPGEFAMELTYLVYIHVHELGLLELQDIFLMLFCM
jgi:Ion channel